MPHISLEFWGWLSLAISLVSYAAYLRSIFQGKTKPHMFSWLVWGILSAIVFFAQNTGGGGPGAWATGTAALASFTVAVLALFRGKKNITRSDWASFIAALTAIPLWHLTKNPFWSVVLISLIDALGFYPTFRKSWHKPGEELLLAYSLSAVIFFISILALERLNGTTALYPATLVVMNSAFVLIVLWRRRHISGYC